MPRVIVETDAGVRVSETTIGAGIRPHEVGRVLVGQSVWIGGLLGAAIEAARALEAEVDPGSPSEMAARMLDAVAEARRQDEEIRGAES